MGGFGGAYNRPPKIVTGGVAMSDEAYGQYLSWSYWRSLQSVFNVRVDYWRVEYMMKENEDYSVHGTYVGGISGNSYYFGSAIAFSEDGTAAPYSNDNKVTGDVPYTGYPSEIDNIFRPDVNPYGSELVPTGVLAGTGVPTTFPQYYVNYFGGSKTAVPDQLDLAGPLYLNSASLTQIEKSVSLSIVDFEGDTLAGVNYAQIEEKKSTTLSDSRSMAGFASAIEDLKGIAFTAGTVDDLTAGRTQWLSPTEIASAKEILLTNQANADAACLGALDYEVSAGHTRLAALQGKVDDIGTQAARVLTGESLAQFNSVLAAIKESFLILRPICSARVAVINAILDRFTSMLEMFPEIMLTGTGVGEVRGNILERIGEIRGQLSSANLNDVFLSQTVVCRGGYEYNSGDWQFAESSAWGGNFIAGVAPPDNSAPLTRTAPWSSALQKTSDGSPYPVAFVSPPTTGNYGVLFPTIACGWDQRNTRPSCAAMDIFLGRGMHITEQDQYYFIARKVIVFVSDGSYAGTSFREYYAFVSDGVLGAGKTLGFGGDIEVPVPAAPTVPARTLWGYPVVADVFFAVVGYDLEGFQRMTGVSFGEGGFVSGDGAFGWWNVVS